MKRKNSGKAHARGLTIFLAVLILLSGISLYGVINAKTVRLIYGTVPLTKLDYRLDGAKILYISDLKISSEREAKQTLKLIERLCELNPDAVLIGGDITDKSLWDSIKILTHISSREDVDYKLLNALDVFLSGLNQIKLPSNVFAVYGDTDIRFSTKQAQSTRLRYLDNENSYLTINGAKLPIYGASSASMQLTSTDGAMIILFHDPALYKSAALRASERGGGANSYLLLSAHALDGQISIGSLNLFYSDINKALSQGMNDYGIYSDGSGIKMLLSSGIGSEGLSIRIGTRPCAYLLTLRSA